MERRLDEDKCQDHHQNVDHDQHSARFAFVNGKLTSYYYYNQQFSENAFHKPGGSELRIIDTEHQSQQGKR